MTSLKKPSSTQIKNEANQALKKAGVDKRFLSAAINDFSSAFHDVQGSIFVYGPRGTGKTHYLCAVMKEFLIQKIEIEYEDPEGDALLYGKIRAVESPPAIFLPVPELMLLFKQSYSSHRHETETEILDRLAARELLVLDDLGAERVSDWSIQMLYLLIDRRYRRMKKTLISSNLSPAEIAEKLDDRIASRLSEMCEMVRFEGEDRRMGGGEK